MPAGRWNSFSWNSTSSAVLSAVSYWRSGTATSCSFSLELGGDLDLELTFAEVIAILARAVLVVAHVARGELARDRAPLDLAAGRTDRRERHHQSHQTHTDPHALAPSDKCWLTAREAYSARARVA